MIVHDPRAAAAAAVSANPSRPASAVIHDAPGARLVVFRIDPGQQVAPHTSTSSVVLTIVSGSGVVSGGDEERRVQAGATITYAPNELHGMRAEGEQLCVLAVIAPRPGG